MSESVIKIEIVEHDVLGGRCGAVIVTHGENRVQTPYMIGQWKEAAQKISQDLSDKYPNIPQEKIGF